MARPNIIVIVAHRLRWDSPRFAGNSGMRTPNLDALAAMGVSFTETIGQYPAPDSAMATLFTGQYPNTHGLVPPAPNAAIPRAQMMPQILQEAGYETGAIGGMGVIAAQDQPPLFDVERPLSGSQLQTSYQTWLAQQTDAKALKARPPGVPLPEPLSETTWIGNESVRFLQQTQEPFALFIHFNQPALPLSPPEPWAGMYLPESIQIPSSWENPKDAGAPEARSQYRRTLAAYYAAISHMDHQVGRLLATLIARIFTNNLIIFTSDFGASLANSEEPFKADGPLYDPLIRVPLVIAGVCGQRKSATDNALAQTTDILPTALEAAGLDITPSIEGRSLLPILTRQRRSHRATAFTAGPGGALAARTRAHKLIQCPGHDLFFDLTKDPLEVQNLSDKEEASRAKARLQTALQRFSQRRGE